MWWLAIHSVICDGLILHYRYSQPVSSEDLYPLYLGNTRPDIVRRKHCSAIYGGDAGYHFTTFIHWCAVIPWHIVQQSVISVQRPASWYGYLKVIDSPETPATVSWKMQYSQTKLCHAVVKTSKDLVDCPEILLKAHVLQQTCASAISIDQQIAHGIRGSRRSQWQSTWILTGEIMWEPTPRVCRRDNHQSGEWEADRHSYYGFCKGLRLSKAQCADPPTLWYTRPHSHMDQRFLVDQCQAVTVDGHSSSCVSVSPPSLLSFKMASVQLQVTVYRWCECNTDCSVM